MSDYTKYTKQEMQAYAIAKSIKENQIVIVGTGLPLIGASLAKRAICPSCHPIVESGLMDCDPVEVPRSVGDNRFMAHCAVQWPNIRFVGFEANEWLHDEDRLVAFIGGAQIDPYGNVNSTCIFGKGDYLQPTTRFTGSGGANGIATYCNTIIMMQHQKRRFIDHVDYITSCGWMDGPGGRERAGLPGGLALLHAGHHIRHVLQPLLVHALELVKALGELGLGVTVGGVAALFQFAGQTFHSICILQM